MARLFSKRDRKLKKQFEHQESLRTSTPVEALRLAEDIQTLELVMDLLGRLDAATIRDSDNESGTTLRRLTFILVACRNQARDRLRDDYLAGKPPLPRPKRQTLADVWQILLEDLDKGRK